MVNHDIVYNLDNLVSLPDERRRVMNAVEDAQWQDDFEQLRIVYTGIHIIV